MENRDFRDYTFTYPVKRSGDGYIFKADVGVEGVSQSDIAEVMQKMFENDSFPGFLSAIRDSFSYIDHISANGSTEINIMVFSMRNESEVGANMLAEKMKTYLEEKMPEISTKLHDKRVIDLTPDSAVLDLTGLEPVIDLTTGR